jgi:hypothetical protein
MQIRVNFLVAVLILNGGAPIVSTAADIAPDAQRPMEGGTLKRASPAAAKYRVIDWGVMLSTPSTQPSYAHNLCAYQGAELIQLDKNTVLYVVSLHEVGGGDRCLGNQGFLLKSAEDLKRATLDKRTPIEINGPQKCKLSRGRDGELIKYLIFGGMVPLDAVDEHKNRLPVAGKGVFFSAYAHSDLRTKQICMDIAENGFEAMHVEWDGHELKVVERELLTGALGLTYASPGWNSLVPDGSDFVSVMRISSSRLDGPGGMVAVRWRYTGRKWEAAERSDIVISKGGVEPSLVRRHDGWLLYTRGEVGRCWFSKDLKHFKPYFEQRVAVNGSQCLSLAPDGEAYLVANPPHPGLRAYIRNPLNLYPVVGRDLGSPITIHDERGVTDFVAGSGSIPFICHGRGRTVFLDGRWRHFICYRHSDLMDLELYDYQKAAGLDRQFEALVGPNPDKGKNIRGGTAVAELIWEGPAKATPWHF